MMLKVDIQGLQQLSARIDNMGKQVRYATSRAINRVAHSTEKATYAEMQAKFDRPTPYTMRSLKVKRSMKTDLVAIVGIKGSAPGLGYDAPSKGTPWEKALGHQFRGGERRWKKFEAALMRIGVLPPGMAAVPPTDKSWAAPLDQYGNIPASLIVILLSYFNAFSEQGYKANMSDKRRKKLHGVGRSASGYKTINGVMYFAVPRRGFDGATRHIHPGIWAKRGTHGADLAPVLLFVRKPTYKRRIDMERIANEVAVRDFSTAFNEEMDNAIRTAK